MSNVNSQTVNKTHSIIIVITFTCFIMATYAWGLYLLSSMMSDIKRDLSISYTFIGTIAATAQIGFLITASSTNLIVRYVGAGRVILGSILLSGMGMIALSKIDNPYLMTFIFFILGGCTASAWTPMVGLISEVVTFKHQAKSLGLIASGTNYGLFLNGLMVPYFLTNYTWRAVWMTTGVTTLLLASISFIIMSRANQLRGGHKKLKDKVENNVSSFNEMMKRKPYLIWFINLLSGLACVPFLNYISPFIRDDLGFSVELTGTIWMLIGLLGMLSGIMVGTIADKIGIKPSLFMMYILVLIAGLILLFYPNASLLYLTAITFGIAFNGIFGLIPAHISKIYPQHLTTGIFGFSNVMMGTGAMLGNFLTGWSKNKFGEFFQAYSTIAIVIILLMVLTTMLPKEEKIYK